MVDWTDGYVTELAYTYGYYQELNPLRAQWALLNAGFQTPDVGGEGFAACELGFGQGMSLNIHAAGTGGAWWGTDFNPTQTAFAQRLADASEVPLQLYDDAFSEFSQRAGMPQFDFICLHGIWSWISDENRKVIVDFVRKRLKVGGVLYISYNTLPGWSNGMPLRQLMIEHSRTLAAPGAGIVQRIDAALDFSEKFFNLAPAALKAAPQMAERLERIKGQSRSYLAHEYFNRDWRPMYFSEMAQWLGTAKLNFGTSVHLLDHLPALNFTPEHRQLLESVTDPVFRETVRDFCVNQQFRKDLWTRGAQQLNAREVATAMRNMRVVLTQSVKQVGLSVKGPAGEVQMNSSIYGPLLDVVSDYCVATVGDLEKRLAGKVTFPQLREALNVLIGSGALAPAAAEHVVEGQRKFTDRLNAAIVQMAHLRGDLGGVLASPVTGGGVPVNRFEQFFLAARSQQKTKTREWAEYAWSVISANGERLVKEGKTLQAAKENVDELHAQAQLFSDARLPVLRAVGIA